MASYACTQNRPMHGRCNLVGSIALSSGRRDSGQRRCPTLGQTLFCLLLPQARFPLFLCA